MQIGSTRRARRWTLYTSPTPIGGTKTTATIPLGLYFPTSLRHYVIAAQQPQWPPLDGKEKRGTKQLPSWRATRRSFRHALTCSIPGGGTDAVQSANVIGPSLYSLPEWLHLRRGSVSVTLTTFNTRHIRLAVAPAGGVAAATPEGGALAGPPAYPNLRVVGAKNPRSRARLGTVGG
jgi:hypothetical protein